MAPVLLDGRFDQAIEIGDDVAPFELCPCSLQPGFQLGAEHQGEERAKQMATDDCERLQLSPSEIITLLTILHSSKYKYLKSFYDGFAYPYLKVCFPGMPSYERFVIIQKSVIVPLTYFVLSRMGRRTGIYYIDSTALPVCNNRRIGRHKVFAGLAQRGKTSMGWFFGLKLHLLFNDIYEIIAIKLTPGNVADTTPVLDLTKGLSGKLFGGKGHIGAKLAKKLLRRRLTLFTRVRSNMESLPISIPDKMLLNARNMAETIIGHIKAFSSLNLPKHRSPTNGFLHILSAVAAYQINPIEKASDNDFYFPPALPA